MCGVLVSVSKMTVRESVAGKKDVTEAVLEEAAMSMFWDDDDCITYYESNFHMTKDDWSRVKKMYNDMCVEEANKKYIKEYKYVFSIQYGVERSGVQSRL